MTSWTERKGSGGQSFLCICVIPGLLRNKVSLSEVKRTRIFFFFSSFTAPPSFKLPTVPTQCLNTGQIAISVMWEAVTSTNTDGRDIICMLSGIFVPLTGGNLFLKGTHTISCSVTNADGCTATASFTFRVEGEKSLFQLCFNIQFKYGSNKTICNKSDVFLFCLQ